MKTLIILVAISGLCAVGYVPLVPGDNSYYVEGVSRYIWMSDRDGKHKLVDLHEPVNESILQSNNGVNNQYWLFTRRNPTNAQILKSGDVKALRNSDYNPNLQMKVIVHGWNNNGSSEVNTRITAAFLAVLNCNVIVVDWRRLASENYNTASRGVPDVAKHLERFIQWIFNSVGGNWNNVHFVGFSLGAHVVGNAGRVGGGQARRVTGLDPAGPNWRNNPNALNRSSGIYVEAIHTDGRVLGLMDAIAHADFYPNRGMNPQPGCWVSTCSHGRSIELFAATVYHNHLVGRQCANVLEAELAACHGAAFHMGNANLSKNGRGIYGLLTRGIWPF